MSKAAVSLRERRRETTRREAVDSLLGLIEEGGIDLVTIDRVAERSGMARGTLYAHFPAGRNELLRAAYARLSGDLVERSRAAVTAATSWEERLVALAREMVTLAADRRIGYFFNVSGPAILGKAPERGRGSSATLTLVSEILSEAEANGELRAEIDPQATAVLLVGALREIGSSVAAETLTAEDALASFDALVAGLATL